MTFAMPSPNGAPANRPGVMPANYRQALTKIEKAHIALMKHPETCQYGQIMVTGKVSIVESYPTARTNGFDAEYNPHFINAQKKQGQVNYVVFHENIHKLLKHTTRNLAYWNEDPELANAAADYVTNDIIESLQDKTLCERPTDPAPLYLPEFHGWSFGEVYVFLRKVKQGQQPPPPPPGKPNDEQGDGEGEGEPQEGDDEQDDESESEGDDGEQDDEEGEDEGDGKGGSPDEQPAPPKPLKGANGKEYRLDSMDQHDLTKGKSMTPEEIKEAHEAIDQALQQGGIMAGRFGAKVPRQVGEVLAPKIDWREILRDFVSNSIKGRDEFTWRKFNRRHLADDVYLPTTESETVGEVVNCGDTSGSIGDDEIARQTSEVASICEMCEPELFRQLWWDTQVHAEQVFEPGQYSQIRKLMKPVGGGGTHAGCVSDYLVEKKIKAECVIMMTDGYTEQPIEWKHDAPVLWLVTCNKNFQPPAGHKMVMMED